MGYRRTDEQSARKKKLWWRDEEAVQRVFFGEKVPTRDMWGAQKGDLRRVTWPELKNKEKKKKQRHLVWNYISPMLCWLTIRESESERKLKISHLRLVYLYLREQMSSWNINQPNVIICPSVVSLPISFKWNYLDLIQVPNIYWIFVHIKREMLTIEQSII